jgi:hypothetical protein
VRLDHAQGRDRRCDAPRLYAHDSSGCRLPSSAFGQFILAGRHFPSQTFCNCRRLSGAALCPLRSIMARSDVGLLGTDPIPSGPFFATNPLAKRSCSRAERETTRTKPPRGLPVAGEKQPMSAPATPISIPNPVGWLRALYSVFGSLVARPMVNMWPSALRLHSGQSAATRGITRPTCAWAASARCQQQTS